TAHVVAVYGQLEVRACCHVTVWLLFFFQAEDGIRDDLVTGVQTCALPIFRRSRHVASPSASPTTSDTTRAGQVRPPATIPNGLRSEERRVGKSVKLRGRRGIKKK